MTALYWWHVLAWCAEQHVSGVPYYRVTWVQWSSSLGLYVYGLADKGEQSDEADQNHPTRRLP